jgi:hypothetical protein
VRHLQAKSEAENSKNKKKSFRTDRTPTEKLQKNQKILALPMKKAKNQTLTVELPVSRGNFPLPESALSPRLCQIQDNEGLCNSGEIAGRRVSKKCQNTGYLANQRVLGSLPVLWRHVSSSGGFLNGRHAITAKLLGA